MNDQRTERSGPAIALAGMLALLALAYGLDKLIMYLRMENAKIFSRGPALLWIFQVSNLVLALCAFALFWFVNGRSGRSKLINSIDLALGVVGLIYLPLIFTRPASTTTINSQALTLILQPKNRTRVRIACDQ